jgi:hypothetical protein
MTPAEQTSPARDRSEENPIRVGVLGARGQVGTEVCTAVDAAADMELVAMVDAGDWMFNVADAGAEVVVDFTHPDVVMDNVRFCVDQGIHAVVGTTGFTEARLAQVREWLAPKPDLGVLIAVLRIGGDRGAAPPTQGRRTVGHRSPHRGAHRGCPSAGQDEPAPGCHHPCPARGPGRRCRRGARAFGAVDRPSRAPGGVARH